MKDALANALSQESSMHDTGVDRVMAASFFRTRPLQYGSADVVSLTERRAANAASDRGLASQTRR